MNNDYKPWLRIIDDLVKRAKPGMEQGGPEYDAWDTRRWQIQSSVFGMLKGDTTKPIEDGQPDYRYLAVMAARKLDRFEAGMADPVFACWLAGYEEWKEKESIK